MLHVVKGCHVPCADMLREGYACMEDRLVANVNAEKMEAVFYHFSSIQKERMFLILELPTNRNDEPQASLEGKESLHRDIYYMDGCDQERLSAVMQLVGEWLIHDGLLHFGIGCHESHDEIMFYKYNQVIIWSKAIEHYDGFFESHQIERREPLLSAWDTFSRETPGECFRYEKNGVDIYWFLDDLKKMGLYFAERREVL